MLVAFSLGGLNPPQLDIKARLWYLTQSRTVGVLQTTTAVDLDEHTVMLPARDKLAHVFGTSALAEFIAGVDSLPGPTYRDKLECKPDGDFLVVNIGTDHRSYAVHAAGLTSIGLVDTQHQAAYLVSYTADDAHLVRALLVAHPLRYLIYRFATTERPYFVQAEAVCSKWRRWSANGHLLAFNALDRRLFG